MQINSVFWIIGIIAIVIYNFRNLETVNSDSDSEEETPYIIAESPQMMTGRRIKQSRKYWEPEN